MQRRHCLRALSLPALALAGCGGGGSSLPPAPAPDPVTRVGTLEVSQHAAVSAADGSVIIIGGDRGLSTLSDAVDRFDPATGRLTRIGSLSSGRASFGALRLADGRILVAGGMTSLDRPPIAEIIDPARGSVVDGGRLAQSRSGHSMTLLADGRVLVCGGVSRQSAELWDPQSARWRLLPARMHQARAFHSATLLPDGRVLLVGGDAAGPVAEYRFAELWDPASEAFTPLDSGITEQRWLHTAWCGRDGRVSIVGGENTGGDKVTPLATAWRFDPGAARFVAAAGLSVARTLAAPVLVDDDGVLLIGGQTATAPASARLSSWSAADGERPGPDLPAPRVWHTAHRLPAGRTLVVGGEDGHSGFASDLLILESPR